MNVTCPQCATVFRVDPAKVPEGGVRARCSVCSGLIAVHRALARSVPVPPHPRWRRRPGKCRGPRSRHSGQWLSPLLFGRRGSTATRAPADSEPQRPPAPEPTREPVGAPQPAAAEVTEPPAPTPPPAIAPLPPPPAPVGAEPRSPAAPRFSNPFLQQDPSARARRLARALISDLVVYHPEKRQRGLADGNLKELFGEEIRKSWEEYAEQVGEDVANTTPYFTDALNEILAEGTEDVRVKRR